MANVRKDCLLVFRENYACDAPCSLLSLFPALSCTPVPLLSTTWWATKFTAKSLVISSAMHVLYSCICLNCCHSSSQARPNYSCVRMQPTSGWFIFCIIHRCHQACTLVFAPRSPLQMLIIVNHSLRRDVWETQLLSQTHCSSLLSWFSPCLLFLALIFLFYTNIPCEVPHNTFLNSR